MDILLTRGYFLYEDPHELAVMKPYPPLGLLYLSSHLKAEGFSVDLYDSTFSSWANFETHIDSAPPPVAGIYTNLMTKQAVLRMVHLLKQKGAWVILGGPEPAPYAEEYLNHGADIVVIGEGELTLTELIPHLARYGPTGLEQVQGIAFRTDDGSTVYTESRPQLPDLSAQPWPDRESIYLDRYLTTWETHHGVRSTSLITARGCPYTCTWCSHSVFGETHRRRTVDDAASEVEHLVERYRPDQLWYADDVFTINKRWLLSYADELKRRNMRIPFECNNRADRIHETVSDRVYADTPWAERTDRDLGVSGRYSRQFYDHATRWMLNDVSVHRMMASGSRDYASMAKAMANRWRGRIGMRLTCNQREEDPGSSASGRGWSTQDRTVDGW